MLIGCSIRLANLQPSRASLRSLGPLVRRVLRRRRFLLVLGRPRSLSCSWSTLGRLYAALSFCVSALNFCCCYATGRPMTRQRSPRAVRVKGGRWMRLPRPRPPDSPDRDDLDRTTASDDGYDSCGECDKGLLTSSLIHEATPIIAFLQAQKQGEAAQIVQALCDHLDARERAHSVLKGKFSKVKAKLRSARMRVVGHQNLQGQCARYYRRIQGLQRQLFHAKYSPWSYEAQQPP